MTEKLYWSRPYDTQFEAKIIDVDKDGIILDKTLFYPEGGNQISDKGVIFKEEIKYSVYHVSKNDNIIIHHISEPFQGKLQKGDLVKAEIDWDYRYGIMRAHSSQHVLSAVFKNLLDIDTIRANISYEEVSLHIERSVSEEELEKVFIQFIKLCTYQNLKFQSRILPRDKVIKTEIRGDKTDENLHRIIEIEDYDSNCCGGTHIASSSEIGPIFFYEIKKGSEFKYYLGDKAVGLLSKQNLIITDLASSLNISTINLLNTLKSQIFDLREEKEKLMIRLIDIVAKAPVANINDIKIGVIDFPIEYKQVSKAFKNFPPNYLLILKPEEKKIQILSNNEKIKADILINNLINKFGGKGGGSPRSAQATLEEEPKDLIANLEI